MHPLYFHALAQKLNQDREDHLASHGHYHVDAGKLLTLAIGQEEARAITTPQLHRMAAEINAEGGPYTADRLYAAAVAAGIAVRGGLTWSEAERLAEIVYRAAHESADAAILAGDGIDYLRFAVGWPDDKVAAALYGLDEEEL